MLLSGDYRVYRLAQILSELVGGDELVGYSIHWAEGGQDQQISCSITAD
ncbi:MAG: hypothetical protein HC921_21240 [Synechococcaceae cyanobacterium SM2_3_1]|nr:hypothetical protein [Synechococcaceae cyanobacterium SM2_3_1]